VDVRHITADGVRRCPPAELEALLDGPGLLWVDVKYWDAETAARLAALLHLHDLAVHDCAVRNPIAKVRTYPGQAFVVLHAPEAGQRGHVHFVELDQFVGRDRTQAGPLALLLAGMVVMSVILLVWTRRKGWW
jgi:Mg2+ and Co2+ transporter CorA